MVNGQSQGSHGRIDGELQTMSYHTREIVPCDRCNGTRYIISVITGSMTVVCPKCNGQGFIEIDKSRFIEMDHQ